MRHAGKGLRSLHVEMIARSTSLVARCCPRLGLPCRDTPAVTSSTLQALGYSQYQIREFWQVLELLGAVEATVYKHGDAVFRVVLRHSMGPIYEAFCEGYRIPLDEAEARGIDYEYASKAHRGFIYIEGGYRGVGIKVNAVRILSIIGSRRPELLDNMIDAVVDAAWGRGGRLPLMILEALRQWSRVVGFVIPWIPGSLQDLARVSPLLKRIPGWRDSIYSQP